MLALVAIAVGAPFMAASCVCGDGSSSANPTSTPAPVAAVPVDQFVTAVCTPWNTFYTRYLELFNGFVASTNIVEHKQKLITQIVEMEKASRGLVAAVPTLPKPEGEGGDAVRKAITDLFLREQQTFQRYLVGLQKLDTSDESKFQAQLQALIDSAPENNLEAELGAAGPLGVEVVTAIDAEPHDCGIIFIAF
jgi:hypothetical protein